MKNDSARALHVLTITPFFPREGDESCGCFISEPIAELSKLGIRSTVFSVEPFYRAKPRPLRAAPAEWFRYPSLPGGFGLPSAGNGLYLRLRGPFAAHHRQSRIDLIHAHSALPCGDAAFRLSRQFKVPYAVTVHGLDAFSSVQVGGRAGDRCRAASRESFQSAKRVIAISRHVQKEVEAGAPGSRVSVVYNGADPELFSPDGDPATPQLLSVGNLIPTKGHDLVVKALGALKTEFPGLTWEVIGDGPQLKPLVRLAEELGVAQQIFFRGKQGRSEVAATLRRSTVFVLPSRYEGLGCVYLEAMASGKVAIGCHDQGIAEIIRHGENGWLVSPNNLTELVEGLRILLHDHKLRAKIASAGRETVLRSFTIHHQAMQLAAVYGECVA
jgi:glycosyltransferase involved in cell wall biosynthesis